MLTEKDVSIITQVAFKGAVDAQTKPLDTVEGQAEFAVNFSFLKDILFSGMGGPAQPPAVGTASVSVAQTAPPSPAVAENVVYAQFPGTTTVSPVSIKGTAHGDIPQWLIDQALAVGVTEVWDNRDRLAEGAAKGKRWPWFRSAHENIDKAFWPPKAA